MSFNDYGYRDYDELARIAPQHPDTESTSPYFVIREAPKTDFLARAINTIPCARCESKGD